ncbi:hypothetical protein Clacol_004452 [Clathrus columnatus]|uniref:HNH nuclease domain-containing protein n=1 Tax=Clathrus columnatus TaxID=1419009 RepID=A0AAV5AB25_9AGAM|nr:hypothetical protein Clacol_004452 [Clathrus columnatus]
MLWREMVGISKFRTANAVILENVDAPENAIMLTQTIHSIYDSSMLGILKTPNFALNREHVLPALQPLPNHTGSSNPATLHFTPHYFQQSLESNDEELIERFHRDLRYPNIPAGHAWPQSWPPGFVFDFIYGVAVCRAYGVEDTVILLNARVDRIYYPSGHDMAGKGKGKGKGKATAY